MRSLNISEVSFLLNNPFLFIQDPRLVETDTSGEVVKIHVREKVYEQGRILTDIAKPVGRGAGNDWFKTDNPFEMPRLMNSQIQK